MMAAYARAQCLCTRSAPSLRYSARRMVPVRRGSAFVVRADPEAAATGADMSSGAAPMIAKDVVDDNWSTEVLESELPVVVDFWAPWCGPCRMIAPIVDEIATEMEGKVKVVKLNTDESPGVATELGIRSIPTVMVFKDGKKMDSVIGAVPKETLMKTIEKYLN